MAGIGDRRLEELRKRISTSVATSPAQYDAEAHRSIDATDPAAKRATTSATDVATRVATGGALQRRTQEATVRRAYTVYERQDNILRDLAHELGTDKSDVLRQIIDAWLATQ